MKTYLLLVPSLAVFLLLNLSAAEKIKRSSVSDYPFYSVKKRGHVAQFIPGLNAVLQLTETQVDQIAAARDVMLNDEAVKASRASSKSDPNITAELREKSRAAVETATAQMREKVAAILTAEQKALIEKINTTYATAVDDNAINYQAQFESVKDLETRQQMRVRMTEDLAQLFHHKLDRIFTTDQKQMVARAAEEEGRGLASVGVKKPLK